MRPLKARRGRRARAPWYAYVLSSVLLGALTSCGAEARGRKTSPPTSPPTMNSGWVVRDGQTVPRSYARDYDRAIYREWRAGRT